MTFEAWIALAFPWLPPHSPDYQNLRHAWGAGFAAASPSPHIEQRQGGDA